MERHLDDPALLGEACGALWNLADHPPTRWEILSQHGVLRICQALRRHGRHWVLHRLCCGALESLLNDNDWGRVQLYQLEDDGIALVLNAMRLQPLDEELQSATCGIIAHMALGDLMHLAITSFGTRLVDHGAPSLLLAALERHGTTSAKVTSRACTALSFLCWHAPIRQTLLDGGAWELVQGVLLLLLEQSSSSSSTMTITFGGGDGTTTEDAANVFGTAVMALSQLSSHDQDRTTTTTTTRTTNQNDTNDDDESSLSLSTALTTTGRVAPAA